MNDQFEVWARVFVQECLKEKQYSFPAGNDVEITNVKILKGD